MARGAGLAPGPDSAELARWVASVRARAPREPAPSPELWNAPKLDAAASLARELHRAGDRVRKWTTRAPDAPPTATERGDALEEVVFHVIARAVPASALREDDEAHATDEAKDVASEESHSEAASFARAKALAESFPPFFSTRKDVGGGDGVPVRAFLGDTTGASALEEEEEEAEAEDGIGVETEKTKTESVLPGDACARGLLLALADAPAGTRFLVRVAPEYAYLDPHHGPRMVPFYNELPGSSPERCRSRRFPRPPAGVDAESFLFFDVEVLDRRVAAPVRRPRSLPESSKRNTATAFAVPFATKHVLREGDGFERPRPPFDVSARVEVRVASPATDEKKDDEKTVYAAVAVPETVVRYVSGDGTLPPELDAAVATMRVGEEAAVYVPPRRRPETPPKNARLAMPRDALARAAKHGAEYRVRLLGMTHVRDVFGDGVVVKRRLEEGVGDFPGDCPVRDCAVTARVAVAAASISDDDDDDASSLDEHARAMLREEGDASGSDPFAALASRRGVRFVHDTGARAPFAFRLGAGAVPAAVETSVRLMLPGETALVTVRDARGAGARYAYEQSAPDAPGANAAREALDALGGVSSFRTSGKNKKRVEIGLVFVVRLVGFERPVNWYRAGLAEMLAEADAGRLEGNALLRAGKTELARDKYEKTLRDLRSIRGLETDDEIRATNALVNSVTLNLALASQRLGFHARAIGLVTEILSNDPKHGKALWRRGVSLAATHEYAGARADFRAVAEGDASLRLDVERELRKIDLAERAELRREKDVSASALGEQKSAPGERRD